MFFLGNHRDEFFHIHGEMQFFRVQQGLREGSFRHFKTGVFPFVAMSDHSPRLDGTLLSCSLLLFRGQL